MKHYSFKKISVLFIFSTAFCIANAQSKKEIKFYDVIKDDSVVMYFNDARNFTGKECALYRRNTRIDSYGDFFHSYIDTDTLNHLLGRGYYAEGKKEGLFEIYYPNGYLKCSGSYHEGIPTGLWNFFYDDGSPERTIQFVINDTIIDDLLIEYFDEKGKQLVSEGNGYFSGRVLANGWNERIIATGKITAGRPDSTWNSISASESHTTYCTEYFEKGKFLYGTFPKTAFIDQTRYNDHSILDNFFIGQYYKTLEKLLTWECPDKELVKLLTTGKPRNKYETDLASFRSFVQDAIGRVIETDGRNGNARDYLPGDNKFILGFTVSEKGVPENFKKMTSWGDQFYYPVSSSLTMHAKLPPTKEKIYFYLILTLDGGNNYKYSFYLSDTFK